jgi:hypothetical protein
MRPITFSFQFRGYAAQRAGGLQKQARAPGCALVTSLGPEGVDGGYVWAPGGAEAYLESELVFTGAESFEERGRIVFARGHALQIEGRGILSASLDPHLWQGTVVWTVAGGDGQFEGAGGRIISSFLLSDTGDLTENQLGVVFVNGSRP